jgi:demethylmenaquinone methyltransferase / 2-methoxy-6-polyprenyl-1,4-benzoquinol methylase
MRVADVATGTGPVAVAARTIVGNKGVVVGVDPSAGMLRVARQKAGGSFVQAVGEALALRGGTFDMLTMGYALRHVSDLRKAFTEYRRVLKPGGQLVIMEISMPRSVAGRALLGAYMGTIAPIIARVGRNRDTATMMKYYWRTTETCVEPAVIMEALRDVGFREVRRELHYGILAEYRAAK